MIKCPNAMTTKWLSHQSVPLLECSHADNKQKKKKKKKKHFLNVNYFTMKWIFLKNNNNKRPKKKERKIHTFFPSPSSSPVRPPDLFLQKFALPTEQRCHPNIFMFYIHKKNKMFFLNSTKVVLPVNFLIW